MKLKITEKWYKRTQRGRVPMRYQCRGYKTKDGKGAGKKVKTGWVTDAVIYKDPILKKHPQLEKAIKKHEIDEIKARARGMSLNQAHSYACKREPRIIKGLNVKQFWDKMK